jgi:hypothetical protein
MFPRLMNLTFLSRAFQGGVILLSCVAVACVSESSESDTTAAMTQTSSSDDSSSTDVDDSTISDSTRADTMTGDGTGDGSETADDTSTDERDCSGRKIYVALEGLTLTPGPADDAPNNVSEFDLQAVLATLDYDGDGPAFVDALQSLFEPFAVCVTAERPADPPYDMVVFSTNGGFSDNVRSLAIPDCMDQNHNNVAFVFIHVPEPDDARAQSAAFALGLTMGLNSHNTNAEDLMNTSTDFPREEWLDVCIPFTHGSCTTSDDCPSGQQNSFQHLMATLGPA